MAAPEVASALFTLQSVGLHSSVTATLGYLLACLFTYRHTR